VYPDHFVDHDGTNQLVHGPIAWKYGLTGYHYWQTVQAYKNVDPWTNQYVALNGGSGANGDGNLFYPGTPKEIGGTSHVPVPSIRLQLLRQSWSLYDQLCMLRDRGKGAVADQIVGKLVTHTHSWSKDLKAYADARMAVAQALAG
jgi:hypothetical protein